MALAPEALEFGLAFNPDHCVKTPAMQRSR